MTILEIILLIIEKHYGYKVKELDLVKLIEKSQVVEPT